MIPSDFLLAECIIAFVAAGSKSLRKQGAQGFRLLAGTSRPGNGDVPSAPIPVPDAPAAWRGT